ncbi:hypothetical protein RHS01_10826 [Rhizoctonia solani]|uniref:Retrotransposon gag domain-containing protein n=1 Tax=Rhizoctonia solani TaxID=456999 RepID=A0A8H7I2M8_9AGAM|nr:hypothetical protein RHS01_10826 [Rhizoctonia solani]
MQGDNNLVGDKDQGGAQTKPGPLTGPATPPTHSGGKPTLQARLGLAQGPFRPSRGTGFNSEEEEEPRRPKKEPRGTPRSLSSLTPFDSGPADKATQWLDRMLLWVALHRDQFNEEEQMVVWILYHMTDKAADWALPIIGTIIKGKGNPPTTIPALMAKFKEAFADPNAKRAAARKIAALTQTTTTSETPVTKDNIPDNDLEAILAALVKIDNTCWENKENQPKKVPAKAPVTATTSTTTTRVCLSEDPNYVTPEERIAAARLAFASSAAKKDMASNNALMAGRPQSRR